MNEAKDSGTITKLILQNDFVSIFFDEVDSLIIRWERQITFDERKETFLWVLQFSKEHKVKNWLIDDENIFLISDQERSWIEAEWPPLAGEAGLVKLAVYIPEYFFNSTNSLKDFTARAQQNYNQYGVTQHEVFMDYQIALVWLRSKS